MSDIRHVGDDEEIHACFEVMRHLRPHLDAAEFLSRIRLQETEGYRLVALWQDGHPLAVAGYRVQTNLYAGRQLYVDDLVTVPEARSCGLGAALLAWLRSTAKSENCAQLHLDSGLQRVDAHRFYAQQGMQPVGYHFRIAV